MSTEEPTRTEQQRAAISARERDVFLRAGAGTGKTTVLVERFCAAALDPDVGVDRILAFTFTDRAADQLRRRVRAELARLAEHASGARLAELREAEHAGDRAWISTIHGFCRRLLATHPVAAGIDPRFRVLDEPEAERLAGHAFDAALDELVEAGDPDALELAAANWRQQLLEMTRSAYDELRSQGKASPELPPLHAGDHSAAIADLVKVARAAYIECESATGSQGIGSRERVRAASELETTAEPDGVLLERLVALKVTSNAAAFKGAACERYARALARARRVVAERVLSPAYEQLRELVVRFGRHYEELKAERSALDFEDLQLRAVELLGASERLRERYREQFRHLMVDEFQDTNQLQLSLIEQLRGAETRLFLVGDEFQSIYGFRHADVDVYRRQHRAFADGREPNGEVMPLTGNFRAAPELVAVTNAIGAALLDGFEPLTAATEAEAPASGDPAVEMLLTVDDKQRWEAANSELPRLADDPSSGSKVAEARLLAGRLRALVDEDEESPAEMVVLLRAFTHVASIERALAEAGLDPYVVGGRGFWSQQQIEDLRCLLATISNPLDDEALFGALASPACGVLPDTLWLLRQAARIETDGGQERLLHIWPLVRDLAERGAPAQGDAEAAARIPSAELERLRRFAGRLERVRRIGTEPGLEGLVDRVASSFGYDLATLMRDDGLSRWANARKLMRLAREFEAREGPDLGAFLEYLETRAAQRDRESEAATRAEGHAGVRVMTVHAAKGLEFAVVAVADLGRNLQLGWTPLRVAAGDDGTGEEATRVGVQLGRLGRPSERLHDYEELAELAADREAEEEGRLAYVAATRAKRRLLLSGTFNENALDKEPIRHKPISLQLIRSLLDRDVAERDVEVPAAPGGGGFPAGWLRLRVSRAGPGAGAVLLRPRAAGEPTPPAPAAEPPLGRPDPPPALAGGLSYSALSEFGRCGYRFYVERVLGIGDPDQPEMGAGVTPLTSRRYGLGNAVHALLEWSAANRWRDPGIERAQAALRGEGLDGDEGRRDRALELVRAWLAGPLRLGLDGARLAAEAPFVLAIGDALVRGWIDLLAERGDGSVLVVDYKTDRLGDRDPDHAASRYEVQRDLYALAAQARGEPVETAYVFLERADEPVLHRFEEKELAEARFRIEGLLSRLAAGSFEVTSTPHRALCHDCPARQRLCSYERELRERELPQIIGAES